MPEIEQRIRSIIHYEITIRVPVAGLHRSVLVLAARRAVTLCLAGDGLLWKCLTLRNG